MSTYRITYHDQALKGDFLEIPPDVRMKILEAIRVRLAVEPKRFGKPLRGTAKGLWRMRFGRYRVVYKIGIDEVIILRIAIRRKVYWYYT